MAEIVMPRLSDTMEEGTILRWLAQDGDEIARGGELVEIETDKAAMTYESDQAGVLEIVAAEGSTLPVGAVIARVGARSDAQKDERPAQEGPAEAFAAQNEAASDNGAATASERTTTGEPVAAASSETQAAASSETAAGASSQAQAAAPRAPAAAAASGAPVVASPGEDSRVRASPLARRMAREAGIELASIAGSGPGGRIVRADVASATGAAPATATAASTAPSAAAPSAAGSAQAAASAAGPRDPSPDRQAATLEGVARAKGETTTVELSRTQQTIARRMAESKATIPEFTLAIDVDMERCVELRAELKRLAQGDGQATPTYNDMVVKAAALALREYSRANGSYKDGTVLLHARVNVGVAVAANEALIVPTIFDADVKALGEIAREARALIERVRAGTITPPELGGGTFTVSNLGMYGIRSFTPIINPPQAAILSVGALQPRVVARDGGCHIRQTMTLTLVCDHRILYGADAAEFLARIRELLQSPSALTLLSVLGEELSLEVSERDRDIDAAARIWAAATAARDGEPDDVPLSESRPRVEAELAAPGSVLLVLLDLSRSVRAFATAEPRPGTPARAHLGTLAVAPECWGRGIGAALMRALPQRLRELGFQRAQLAVYEDNARALALYERAGWQRTDATAVHPRSRRTLRYYELSL